ncbi:RNA 2',3'-cyclic phosphodiesterase [Vibrio natriegens]|uniref:RNA 2',3'-cyclic phosphodiesterase n=1 Tax=Vibrio natriegens TaxID=691 RepID=UPI000803C964|nr:RNA 2',3'-cyclic phosphodiesterase [Vibrio natriegens]ANQ29629.1 2'-5' RNA ligase [Vibrio natriegens]MCY9878554.1 RNA 2',3'-cyclic phosphodiesterase [Vibrio natriegens]
MRLFFALTFDNDTKRNLMTYQNLLRSNGINGRHTRTANLHLTLAFVGEATQEQKQKLIRILRQLKSKCDGLQIDHLGAFHQKRSRLVWMGIASNRALMNLQRELTTALKAQGFATEAKKYMPHITLFRHDTGDTQLKYVDVKAQHVDVYSIALMESIYVDNKLAYRVIDEVFQSQG